MRERLVLAFVGLTVVVIALYGIPRAYFLADLVRDDTAEGLAGTATAMAALVAERSEAGGAVDAALLENGLGNADRVEYSGADGRELTVGEAADEEGAVVERRTLPDGGSLTLTVSGDTVDRGIEQALLPLVLLGVGLAAGAGALGLVLARRLSRPFQQLAESALELGHGRFDVEVPSSRVPEVRAIATSLQETGARLDQLVTREREFALNASHELRTPVTALRLGLEDLALWPETPPSVREELEHSVAELDRLNTAITDLLELARGRRHDDQADIDLAGLVAAAADRWRSRIQDEGRRIVVRAPGVVPARLAPRPVEQVLDLLVDNARAHGRGVITLETRDAGTHLEVAVSDEGGRAPGTEVFKRGGTSRSDASGGEGTGLAVAAELAEASGGHLSVDDSAPTTTFVLWLPAARSR